MTYHSKLNKMRKAVVIGINEYPKNPLSACVNDAQAIGKLLEKNGDGSPNFDVSVYTDIKTKSELTQLILDLFNEANEISLLYFAGHGAKNELDTYIVTPDAEYLNLGLSSTELLKIANKSKSKNRIILLDCCNSGGIGTTNILGDNLSIISSGLTFLTASKSDESAKETINGHGVFTNLLLQALEGGAADIGGNITPGGVYAYIDQALGKQEQRPVFRADITEFISLRKINPQVDLETLKKIIAYFPQENFAYPLDPSYEFTNNPTIKHEIKEPYASDVNVEVLKNLQKYYSVGLVIPEDESNLYSSAMKSKRCQLTHLGKHYWHLIKKNKL